MTYSMTAFARQEAATPWGSLTWELRSVNHRYLEVSPRLPEELRGLEPRVRELIAARIERGKLDCSLRLAAESAPPATLELDLAQAERVVEAATRLRALAEWLAPLAVAELLRWPGVIKAPAPDVETLGQAALELLGRTLEEFVAVRAREGERLRALIVARLEAAARVVGEVRTVLPEAGRQYRERILARLEEVRQQIDPNRLEQEMVLFSQRADVAEELERLSVHLQEIRRLLDRTNAVGRRLDFLMQELNREANTLGAKAVDVRMTNGAVELKVLIEQMREQVQNIE